MAILVGKVGVRNLELVEDAVQAALLTALESWTTGSVPDEPSAWLYRVAFNKVIQDLRSASARQKILDSMGEGGFKTVSPPEDPVFPAEIRDDMLRMLFICCDDAIPTESRLVFALKSLSGFSIREIALRLFTSEANVYKRLSRARDRLRNIDPQMQTPSLEQLRGRLASVHTVLYLLFTEGYLSAHEEHAIRRELCDEAVRLAELLASHPIGEVPETLALLALMHLHRARLGSRTDSRGGLLLLENQDRSGWDAEEIRLGLQLLNASAEGAVFSRFHAEAGIAAEHCTASSLEGTRWEEIVELYAMLEHVSPSPLHTLNRAVAMAEWRGAAAGLKVLADLQPPTWLSGSYLWDAVHADLYRRVGDQSAAEKHWTRAMSSAPTAAVRMLLTKRWNKEPRRTP